MPGRRGDPRGVRGDPIPREGYRKVRARLAHRGLAISVKRVLRLMRLHHLLATTPGPAEWRPGVRGDDHHDAPG